MTGYPRSALMTPAEHANSAEHWLRQADNFAFPNPARTECLQLAAIHANLALAVSNEPRTYQVQRRTMRAGSPRTFPDGERIIAVLDSKSVSYAGETTCTMTVLVELPGTPREGEE